MSAIIQKEEFLIGYIGRLIEDKGIHTLIRAVSLYKGNDWNLIIIGEGEYKENLVSLCEELGVSGKVKFLGFREDRLAYLKAFNVFCLPSYSEGIPRSVMEAMSADVPVVVSNIDGCKVLVKDRVTGMLHEVNDETDLYKKLLELQENDMLKKAITRNAKNLIKEKYSAVRMSKEYQDLYFDLVR